MSLDKNDIQKIAHLARLSIDEANIPSYSRDLNNIFNLVDELSSANTENILPMAHPLDTEQRLRADVVSEPNQRDAFQSIAPKTEAGIYLVPKVIE